MGTGFKPKQCRELKNLIREASRRSRNKTKKYLKAKIHELQTNSASICIRDL